MKISRPTSENPTAYLTRARVDWLAAHPFKEFLPDWLQPPIRRVQPIKKDDLQKLKLRPLVDAQLNQARGELGKFKTTRKQRRRIEHDLADYLERHGLLADIVPRLRCCRMSGHYGTTSTGEVVIAWDSKCGQGRLCPDESRVEQRRLVRRYKAPAIAWAKKNPYTRRIQKLVVTWPNVPAGDLARHKKQMFRDLAALHKKFPCIRGALISQEDPLSARGDWNLHLNAILLIEGRFEWAEYRAAWHALTAHHFPGCKAADFQIDFKILPRGSDRALESALMECIKYPVKHITAKADAARKRDTAAGDARRFAPGLADWPPGLFMEWWEAGRAFRRTRSYGVLFKLEHIQEIRQEIIWRGRIWWDARARAYAVSPPPTVDLIQGDNSGVWRGKNDHLLKNRPPGRSSSEK